jgi:hypothetical protein
VEDVLMKEKRRSRMQVKLNDIITEMDIPFEGAFSFVNRKTGEMGKPNRLYGVEVIA